MSAHSIRVGFDTSKYSGYTREQFLALAPADLASQAHERQPRTPDAIIATPFDYTVDFDRGQVTSLDSSRSITSHLDWSSSINRETSQAALHINDLLLNPQNYGSDGLCAYAWISPPDPGRYPESRVVVGVSRYNPQTRTAHVKNYGGLYVDLSARDCQEIAGRLSGAYRFSSPPEVRQAAIPVTVPDGADPWAHLSTLFPPHPHLWSAMASSQVDQDYAETRDQAESIISTIAVAHLGLSEFSDARISLEIEHRMQQAVGYAFIAAVSDCDRIYNFGSTSIVPGLEYKFVHHCGACGTSINTYISKGYKCASCGGTYRGC